MPILQLFIYVWISLFLLENLFQHSPGSSGSGRCQERSQKAHQWRCGWERVDTERWVRGDFPLRTS